jgi:hypothetical protein
MIDYWSLLVCLGQNLHISQVKAASGPLRYCTGHDAGCPYHKATCDAVYNVILMSEALASEPGARQGGAGASDSKGKG